mgnify:CR=1 FL=1
MAIKCISGNNWSQEQIKYTINPLLLKEIMCPNKFKIYSVVLLLTQNLSLNAKSLKPITAETQGSKGTPRSPHSDNTQITGKFSCCWVIGELTGQWGAIHECVWPFRAAEFPQSTLRGTWAWDNRTTSSKSRKRRQLCTMPPAMPLLTEPRRCKWQAWTRPAVDYYWRGRNRI